MQQKLTDEKVVFQKLSAICARAEHCQHDMLEKMRQWGVDQEVQARVMERLLKERYIDDERFARAFVHDKVKYNQWGRRKVEQALWLKHIDEHVARTALDEIEENDYLSVLRPMLKQKRKSLLSGETLSDYELNVKLMKWAMGRGFTMDVIKQCINIDADDEY